MLPHIPALERLYGLGNREAVLFPSLQARLLPALIRGAGFQEENRASCESDKWRQGDTEFAAIRYTLSGRGRLRFHAREMVVEPGQAMFLLFPNNHRSWIDAGERWEFFYLTLSGLEAVRGIREIIERRGPVVTLGRDSPALACAADACATALEGKIESPYRSSELAYAIVMGLLNETVACGEDANFSAQPAPAFVLEVEHFCRLNLARPIGVQDMARVAKMSRFYFSRKFEKARGVSPGRYLARLRLDEATRLVAGSELTMGSIAGLCGFGDANYLCKVFRKNYGVSAGTFKTWGTKQPVAQALSE
jgi:AraC-like DNA-binding protein